MLEKYAIQDCHSQRGEVKALKDRYSLLTAASDFKLKPKIVYHYKNPKALKNYTKSTLPYIQKGDGNKE